MVVTTSLFSCIVNYALKGKKSLLSNSKRPWIFKPEILDWATKNILGVTFFYFVKSYFYKSIYTAMRQTIEKKLYFLWINPGGQDFLNFTILWLFCISRKKTHKFQDLTIYVGGWVDGCMLNFTIVNLSTSSFPFSAFPAISISLLSSSCNSLYLYLRRNLSSKDLSLIWSCNTSSTVYRKRENTI